MKFRIRVRIKYINLEGSFDNIIKTLENLKEKYPPSQWENLEIVCNSLFGDREETNQEKRIREQREDQDKIRQKKQEEKERKLLAKLKEKYES